jgi:Bacterial PH domain
MAPWRRNFLRDSESVVQIIRPSTLKNFWDYFLICFLLLGASLFAFRLVQEGWLGISLFCLCIFCALLLFVRLRRQLSRNYWVVTTERLVDIERPGLLKEELTIAEFDDITGVQIRRSGFSSALFGLADILIDTNDLDYLLTLRNVRRPEQSVDAINTAIDNFSAGRRIKDESLVLKNLYKILPTLNRIELTEIKNRVDNLLAD